MDQFVDFFFLKGYMCNQWQVGNYPPTPSCPLFGGAPLEELPKKIWSRANFSWSGVELVDLFGYFFMEWSCFWWSEQSSPKHPLGSVEVGFKLMAYVL